MRRRLDETEAELGRTRHKNKGLELEKADLMSVYRTVVEERGQLEGGVESMLGERKKAGEELDITRNELERKERVIEEIEGELRKRGAELAAFERQLDGVSRGR